MATPNEDLAMQSKLGLMTFNTTACTTTISALFYNRNVLYAGEFLKLLLLLFLNLTLIQNYVLYQNKSFSIDNGFELKSNTKKL